MLGHPVALVSVLQAYPLSAAAEIVRVAAPPEFGIASSEYTWVPKLWVSGLVWGMRMPPDEVIGTDEMLSSQVPGVVRSASLVNLLIWVAVVLELSGLIAGVV